jgi:hypothetical protein
MGTVLLDDGFDTVVKVTPLLVALAFVAQYVFDDL